jgi:serine/threonine protein kinase
MVAHSLHGVYSEGGSQILWEDGERVFRRGWRVDDDRRQHAVLTVVPASEHPSRSTLDRLAHEYELKDELDEAWALRPLDLLRDSGRTMLVLEDTRGELLGRLLGAPMEVGRFLRLGSAIAAALGKLHQRGLVHKDIKPANILLNETTGEVWLTGFGIASRLARERQWLHRCVTKSSSRSPARAIMPVRPRIFWICSRRTLARSEKHSPVSLPTSTEPQTSSTASVSI